MGVASGGVFLEVDRGEFGPGRVAGFIEEADGGTSQGAGNRDSARWEGTARTLDGVWLPHRKDTPMRRLWRIAGSLFILQLVLLLAGYSQQRSPNFGASPGSVVSLYRGVPAGQMYVGAILVSASTLVLLVAFTLVARLLLGPTETGGWFSGLILTAATTAAVVTLTGSYAGAFSAYYAATHGFPADVVTGLNMVSKFSDLIGMAANGICALAVGAAGLAVGRLPRWAAWISMVVGVVGLVSGTGPAQLNAGTLVWFGWLIMFGVVLLRGPARRVLAASGEEFADPVRASV